MDDSNQNEIDLGKIEITNNYLEELHNDKNKPVEKLIEKLEEIRKNLAKANSWKRNFLMGILRGVGAFIGATIVAGLLLSLLSTMIDSVNDVPIIGDLVQEIREKLDLEEINQEKKSTNVQTDCTESQTQCKVEN